jgi:hypothetical protein
VNDIAKAVKGMLFISKVLVQQLPIPFYNATARIRVFTKFTAKLYTKLFEVTAVMSEDVIFRDLTQYNFCV